MRPPAPRCDRRPPRRLEEMSSIDDRLACFGLARARPFLVDRPGGDLLGGVIADTTVQLRLLDVLVLALTLGAPRLRWHLGAPFVGGGSRMSYPAVSDPRPRPADGTTADEGAACGHLPKWTPRPSRQGSVIGGTSTALVFLVEPTPRGLARCSPERTGWRAARVGSLRCRWTADRRAVRAA